MNQDLPKGQSGEATTGVPANQAGVYRHEAASASAGKPVELIVLPDAQTNAQADALVRMGFVRVGPPPTRQELADMQAKQLEADLKAAEAGVDSTAVQNNAPDTTGTIFNGSSDRQSATDKDAELRTLRAQVAGYEAAATAKAKKAKAEPAPEAPAPAEAPAPEVPAEPAPEVPVA